MIFYKKEPTVPALSRKTVQLEFAPYAGGKRVKNGGIYPQNCLNFCGGVGSLHGGFGTKRIFETNPLDGRTIKALYIYGDPSAGGKLIALTDSGMYGVPLGSDNPTPVLISRQNFSALPHGIKYTDKSNVENVIFFSAEGVFYYAGSSLWKVGSAVAAAMGCVYYERLFFVSATQKNRVEFSYPLDKLSWGGAYRTGGYISLSPEHGGIYALIPMGKGLYALRERGITLIRAEAENFNFTATPVAETFGRVYAETVQCVGGKIVFLTSEGLYAFDGSKVKRIAENFTESVSVAKNPDCRSTVWGAYYILNFQTAAGVRRTLFFDVVTEKGWLSDMYFAAAASDGTNCYLSDGGEPVTMTKQSVCAGEPLRTVWESGETDFELGAGEKILRYVTLYGKGTLKLTVRGGHACEERRYCLTLDGQQTVTPLLRNAQFSLRIEGESEDCALEKLEAGVDVLQEDARR